MADADAAEDVERALAAATSELNAVMEAAAAAGAAAAVAVRAAEQAMERATEGAGSVPATSEQEAGLGTSITPGASEAAPPAAVGHGPEQPSTTGAAAPPLEELAPAAAANGDEQAEAVCAELSLQLVQHALACVVTTQRSEQRPAQSSEAASPPGSRAVRPPSPLSLRNASSSSVSSEGSTPRRVSFAAEATKHDEAQAEATAARPPVATAAQAPVATPRQLRPRLPPERLARRRAALLVGYLLLLCVHLALQPPDHPLLAALASAWPAARRASGEPLAPRGEAACPAHRAPPHAGLVRGLRAAWRRTAGLGRAAKPSPPPPPCEAPFAPAAGEAGAAAVAVAGGGAVARRAPLDWVGGWLAARSSQVAGFALTLALWPRDDGRAE